MNLRNGIYNQELRITIVLINYTNQNHINWNKLNNETFIRD